MSTQTWHVPDALLERFATLDGEALAPAEAWSIEAHLERCADCRARLAECVPIRSPELVALVDGVHAQLGARLVVPPAARPRRRLARRVTGGLLLSRALACVAVLGVALLLDLIAVDGAPSWVLLVAPVLPVIGVAASWSRGLDPAYDVVAATPAAGLFLLLWRTLAVLLVVGPVAAVAGSLGGGAPAAWLAPCIAVTASALALGSVIDLARATAIVVAAWGLGVIAPALARQELPAALEGAGLPVWAALAGLAAAVIAVRRTAYRR